MYVHSCCRFYALYYQCDSFVSSKMSLMSTPCPANSTFFFLFFFLIYFFILFFFFSFFFFFFFFFFYSFIGEVLITHIAHARNMSKKNNIIYNKDIKYFLKGKNYRFQNRGYFYWKVWSELFTLRVAPNFGSDSRRLFQNLTRSA